jgi:membrane-associated protease RseP (regulator of RpoE activity)
MKQALQLAAGVVIGAVVPMALLVVPWPSLRIGWPGWVAVAVALPVIFLVLVAVHEGGHLVAGAAARFRPCLFIVGPVKFERRDSGWSAGVNRVFPLAGGMVGATPEGIDGLRPRMLRWSPADRPQASRSASPRSARWPSSPAPARR